MRVTLDGFIAGPHGEMDWMEEFLDEALANYESELQKTVDTTLFGRVIECYAQNSFFQDTLSC